MHKYLKEAKPRPKEDLSQVRNTVSEILESVRAEGVEAVRRYSKKFDNWAPDSFKVNQDMIRAAKMMLMN